MGPLASRKRTLAVQSGLRYLLSRACSAPSSHSRRISRRLLTRPLSRLAVNFTAGLAFLRLKEFVPRGLPPFAPYFCLHEILVQEAIMTQNESCLADTAVNVTDVLTVKSAVLLVFCI